jgi:prenylcysteine alpha-carboxyl methylesterase
MRNLIAYLLASHHLVKKNVKYGDRPRNNMNIYLPVGYNSSSKRYPVVMFVHGGIWIQGDKNLYHKLGEHFSKHNIICVIINYTLYPKGIFEDMLDDIQRAISWIVNTIDKYNGDTSRITLFGHSAGAHLIGLALVDKCKRERKKIPDTWHLKDIHSWIAMSGVYDLQLHYQYEKNRLVHIISPMWRAATSVERFPLFSPALLLEQIQEEFEGYDDFPCSFLYHGGNDMVCPPKQTSIMAESLRKRLKTKQHDQLRNMIKDVILDGWQHSDLITSFIGMNFNQKKMDLLWKDIEEIVTRQ